VEERDVAKVNNDMSPTPRTQSRISCAWVGLEGVREAARSNKGKQFTALLHHVTPQLLAQSFYTLPRDVALGVDSMPWREYEEGFLQRVFGMS
jgi:RNA-directed DNA polymerase